MMIPYNTFVQASHLKRLRQSLAFASMIRNNVSIHVLSHQRIHLISDDPLNINGAYHTHVNEIEHKDT